MKTTCKYCGKMFTFVIKPGPEPTYCGKGCYKKSMKGWNMQWRVDNKAHIDAYSREYYRQNREARIKYQKEYNRKHEGRV